MALLRALMRHCVACLTHAVGRGLGDCLAMGWSMVAHGFAPLLWHAGLLGQPPKSRAHRSAAVLVALLGVYFGQRDLLPASET